MHHHHHTSGSRTRVIGVTTDSSSTHARRPSNTPIDLSNTPIDLSNTPIYLSSHAAIYPVITISPQTRCSTTIDPHKETIHTRNETIQRPHSPSIQSHEETIHHTNQSIHTGKRVSKLNNHSHEDPTNLSSHTRRPIQSRKETHPPHRSIQHTNRSYPTTRRDHPTHPSYTPNGTRQGGAKGRCTTAVPHPGE